MNIEFQKAKDNNKTVKINNIYIHSSYNPIREAESFVKNLKPAIKPSIIFILEPGFSYILPFLRTFFSDSKLCCIRITDIFHETDSLWDKVIYFNNNLSCTLSEYFSDEDLCSSVFYSWKPSENVFYNEFTLIWHQIKKAIEQSRTLLITREYFEKKWLVNYINFIKYTDSYFSIKKIDIPIVITASGPSLENSIEILKKYRKKYFLISLSSSISVLKYHNILPDLSFSTDGGFWANHHLRPLLSETNKSYIAIANESYCSKKLLTDSNIIPLTYSDGLSAIINSEFNLPSIYAKRNGTVSGTALEFAIDHTQNRIFFCGLDLASSSSFQHARPNMLETNFLINTNKINSMENGQTHRRFNTGSLNIYRDWFCNFKKTGNLFRVIETNQTSLGNIKDISNIEFETFLSDLRDSEKKYFQKIECISDKKNLLDSVKTFVIENLYKENWQKQLFPLDFTAMNNSIDENQKIFFQNKISEKTDKLKNKIRNILDE